MRAKILNASAGSGKTYQLAYKYVRDVVEQPAIYRHILAVTFTNKATEEMKSRILKEIHTLASGGESPYLASLCRELALDAATVRKRAAEARSKILHDYSRFTVLTIDTFFQRILRAFIKELGIDLNYNVEIETASVLSKSADALIEGIAADRELLRWLTEFVQERIDEGRKWDVRDGILSLGGELFKEKNKESLATARTREELARIVGEASEHARTTQQELCAAAAEAVRLITEAGLTAADFSGKSRSFANWFFTTAAGQIKPYGASVGKMSLTTEGWCAKGSPAEGLVAQLQPLLRRMCDLYDANVRKWNTCSLLRENYRGFALLADLYARVQQLCDEQNMMLLSETKYILSEFIGHNDVPFIYEKVGNRFERFMIDEFQDTSVKEWENFLPLLQNAMAQSDATSVVIVGDIKQSIYRWRGGDWKILHEGAQQALGRADTETVTLRENFRSLPVVVGFNNRSIARIVAADNRTLNAALDEAAARGDLPESECARLRDTLAGAYRDHAQHPRRRAEHPGYVSVETFAEKPPVVERICQLLDKGFRPCDIMILVRGATDGAKVAEELLDFKRRNSEERYRFDVMTQEALVVGRAPVSSFVAASLRLALNPDDRLSRAVCNHFLGHGFDRPLDDGQRAFFRSLRLLPPEEAFERIVMEHDLQRDKRHTAYLQAIHEQILSFCANKIADIALFLRWWDEQGSARSLSIEQSASTIEITTIHKAKGLEKRAVVIPYCSWPLDPRSAGNVQNIVWAEARGEAEAVGRFPVRYKKSMAESGFSAEYYRELVYAHVDNVNLLYVALTRAAESLHVFVPERDGRHVGALLLQSLAAGADATGADGNRTDKNAERETDTPMNGNGGGSSGSIDTTETAAPQTDRTATNGNTGCTAAGNDPVGPCRHTLSEAGERFEFGEFAPPVADADKKPQAEHVVLEHYLTSRADLRLRLPSQRYFDEGERELSPRNFGILMHKAFQEADTEEDIRLAVERMQDEGTLCDADAATLRDMIARAMDNPVVSEWFGGGWERVRNEQEIILPGGHAARRPDRVMTRGTRAVVVDYKFGTQESGRNRRQIGEYLRLLREMGYSDCSGYLWYVKLGEVEKIDEAC